MAARDSRKTVIYFAIFAVLSFALLTPSSLHAQVVGATLSGTITDPSGAVIPHAQVVITNTATGVTRNATADASGFYNTPNLLPGTYRITVSASGFSTQIRTVSLQVGKVTNLVQVTGAAPTVQLASSSISAVVNSTTVRQLPLNGRSWTD